MKKTFIVLFSVFVFMCMYQCSTAEYLKISGLPSQVDPLSCQSHFLSIALNSYSSEKFPIEDPLERPLLEKRLRIIIEYYAIKDQLTKNLCISARSPISVKHTHWRSAVITFLDVNEYRLAEDDFNSSAELLNKLKELTTGGIGVCGVSIEKIAHNSQTMSYGQGHVITILGVNPDSTLRVFNSWEKDKNKHATGNGLYCEIPESAITYRLFDGKYRVYYITTRQTYATPGSPVNMQIIE